ncbi:MAG: hypothetical protein C4520_10195 [Candidatus Abyssobacteria bacterium SURF_5]|uniref:YMGG-like Gly-zipper domain-containing protein n=1 Tax=Abyssobacteria bacterium (strain SURF_5) TaxID=2093360 RepID=A0A3A4NL47_ABYX5|nr:MAG: hypothetical protein C4520_10195 [Candidatus Abyssubacteria bacterium SURF_5]
MKIKSAALLICLSLVFPFSGCASVSQDHRGAAVGAGVGAGAGAVTGAIVDEGLGGAVVGGLVGALIGGAIGHYAYDEARSRPETAHRYSYETWKQPLLEIEEVSASPRTVRAGETVNINMTYALLTPYPNTSTPVTELREITYYGQLVGNPEVRVEHFDGTYSSSVPLHLPPDAGRGEYRVRVTIFTNFEREVRETSFSVR